MQPFVYAPPSDWTLTNSAGTPTLPSRRERNQNTTEALIGFCRILITRTNGAFIRQQALVAFWKFIVVVHINFGFTVMGACVFVKLCVCGK
jgi:hypothetical protein